MVLLRVKADFSKSIQPPNLPEATIFTIRITALPGISIPPFFSSRIIFLTVFLLFRGFVFRVFVIKNYLSFEIWHLAFFA